jgi:putative flippase GtrA
MTRKDLFLSALSGALIAFLLYPIARNLELTLPLYIFLLFTISLTGLIPFGLAIAAFFARRWSILFEVAKFGIVGVLNTLVDVATLNFLSFITGVYSGTPILFFNSVAFLVAVANSYFWNKYWTFANLNRAYGREFAQFLAVSTIGLGLNSGVVYFLTTFITPLAGLSPQAWENVAKAVSIPISFAWNFTGYKLIVFRK